MGIYKKGTYAFSTSPSKIQYLSVIRLVAVLSSADLDTRAHCRSYNYALKVLTLAAAGLAFTTALISVLKFCSSFSTPNEALPIGQ